MKKQNTQFIKFLIVGAIGTLVNMFFLWLFKSAIGLSLEISGIAAIEISVINNFIINNCWTFKKSTNKSPACVKFFKYNASVIIGIGINYAVLLLLTNSGVFYLLSNFIGILCATMSNYIFSSKWAWKNHQA